MEHTVLCQDQDCAARGSLHEVRLQGKGGTLPPGRYIEHRSNFGPAPVRWEQYVAAPTVNPYDRDEAEGK